MRLPALLCLTLALAACAQHPRDMVLSLDDDSRRYRTRQCREARREALAYQDHAVVRTVVGVAGNLIVPLVGTAASLAMTAERNQRREALNRRVAERCMSDPYNERRRPGRRSGRRR